MAGSALDRLHDDGSVIEGDRGVASSLANSENAPFIDLDRRPIREAKNRVRSPARPKTLTLLQLVANR